MTARAEPLGKMLARHPRVFEDGAGDGLKQARERLVPELERRDLFGEAIEQPGMIDQGQGDDGGEAVRRGGRRRPASRRGARRRVRRKLPSPCALLAPESKEPVLHLAAIVIPHARIGDLREQVLKPRLEGGAALRRVDGLRLQFPEPEDVDQRAGVCQTLGKGACPPAPHEIVGVRALRQEGEAEGMAFAQIGQHAVDGARGGRLSGPVAVEADDGLRRELPQQLHLALGEGGAERGDDVGETRLMERDHVHIAFDHDQLALLEGGFAGAGEVEHGRALVEQSGLGRVQIFGLGAGSSARAPKAMMRDLASRMGMVSRLRKRS